MVRISQERRELVDSLEGKEILLPDGRWAKVEHRYYQTPYGQVSLYASFYSVRDLRELQRHARPAHQTLSRSLQWV